MVRLLVVAAVSALALCPVVGQAQTPPAAPAPPPPVYPPYGAPLSLAQAKAAAAAAEAEARKQGWAMVITIVEPNGAEVLTLKMDGAQYGSVDVAERKARTAALFRRPSKDFQDAVKSGNLNSVFTGALAIEGGELIVVDGRVVGAIGASGGSGVQDGQVARAGTAAIKTP
ncbi:MAG: glcG protein [Caulobacter sp.]|nr:glcG protein [Caulobacter sp.]